jgi:hypothetical protein
MTEIVFPPHPCTANALCAEDPIALQCLRDAHPDLCRGPTLLPAYRPYLLSSLTNDNAHVYSQIRAMPPQQHRIISHTVDQHGEYTWPLVEFYCERLLPFQNAVIQHIKNNPTDAGGALVELPGHRATSFEGALMAYQNALLAVRQGKLDRRPAAQQATMADRARAAFKYLQERYAVELKRYQSRSQPRRGTALRDPERGIRQARSSRTAKAITFSNTRQVQYLQRFTKGARIAGRGLLVLDAGIRINRVRETYDQGGDWARTATVETVGMGFGFAAGYATTLAVAGLGTLFLAATPVGWMIMIGAGITAGYMAATAFDVFGKDLAGKLYDGRLGVP